METVYIAYQIYHQIIAMTLNRNEEDNILFYLEKLLKLKLRV